MTGNAYKVEDVLSLVRRPVSVNPEAEYREIGIRSFGRGVFHKDPVSGFEIGGKRVFGVRAGDLLISNVFGWEGAVALAGPAEEDFVGSHRFLTFRVDSELADARYLAAYFYGGPGVEIIQRASPGSAGRNRTLGIKAFASQRILLPPVSEQRRVADKLDAYLSRVDSIHRLRARMDHLRAGLAESLMASAAASVSESVRIGEILTFTRMPVQIEDAGTYQTIGIRSFGRGIIRHPAVSPDGLSKLSYFTFPEGALALSNLMAWEGGISVTQMEDAGYIASNRFFFYLPVDDRVNTSYLRHFLLSKQGLALVGSACSAGAERNRTLGRKRFEALTIPLPSRSVQDQVASILDRLAERLNSAYAEPSLASLRPSILNAAFTGQL
jgi:hypothetical protein